MLNISFPELLVILLIAFLVIGPKDMTKVARGLGKAVKKSQGFLTEMKAYVNADGDSPVKEIMAVKDSVTEVKTEIEKVNPLGELKKELETEIAPVKALNKGKAILKK